MSTLTKWPIPEISDELLDELCQQIRPVVQVVLAAKPLGQAWLTHIVPCDARNESFLWEPEILEVAQDLISVTDLHTYHACTDNDSFKPSVAEVIAQIPEFLRSQVVAFEILQLPDSFGNEGEFGKKILIAGDEYYLATTRLYRRA